jgi:NADP-dependent 3-hydroxy acid dehydrogenase YdfG
MEVGLTRPTFLITGASAGIACSTEKTLAGYNGERHEEIDETHDLL